MSWQGELYLILFLQRKSLIKWFTSFSSFTLEDYVDKNLVGTEKISRACILGAKGGVWATSAGYTVSFHFRSFNPHQRLI
jgi:hypothetical protein